MVAAHDQRKKETNIAFEAFRRYLVLGRERSFAEVARRSGKSSTMIRRWSKQNQWTKRTAEYDILADRRLEELKDIAIREAMSDAQAGVMEMNRTQAAFATQLYRIVGKSMDELELEDAEPLTPLEVIRWLEVGTKIDRMAKQGLLDGFHVEQSIGGNLVTFSDVLKLVYQPRGNSDGPAEIQDKRVDKPEPE